MLLTPEFTSNPDIFPELLEVDVLNVRYFFARLKMSLFKLTAVAI